MNVHIQWTATGKERLMPQHRVPMVLLIAASLAPLTAAAAQPDRWPWDLVRNDGGIVVHRRAVAGSGLHEFRGVALIEAPIAAALAVLNDAERRTEWMKEAVANTRIERTGPYSEIFYSRTGRPLACRRPRRGEPGAHHLRPRRAPGPHRVHVGDAPSVAAVRMPSLRGHWSMWPERGGAWTRIEYQLHADPGGMLPGWVVNLASRQIPHNTIAGMQQQVRRHHYPAFEERMAALPEYRAVVAAAAP
jgi:hypothetical protein